MSALIVASAFGAGLTTSVGPCVAPRYLAVAAMVADANGCARWFRVAAFVAGLLLCYGVVATATTLIGTLIEFSKFVYIGLAVCFLCAGLRALAVNQPCLHRHARGVSAGSAMLTGAAMGMVFSPCCTPIVAMMAGVAALSGSPLGSMSVALAFAAGHVAPLAIAGVGSKLGGRLGPSGPLPRAATAVGGGLSIALACYYGLLA
jgi:cytochrome c-type biogenesis protein